MWYLIVSIPFHCHLSYFHLEIKDCLFAVVFKQIIYLGMLYKRNGNWNKRQACKNKFNFKEKSFYEIIVPVYIEYK